LALNTNQSINQTFILTYKKYMDASFKIIDDPFDARGKNQSKDNRFYFLLIFSLCVLIRLLIDSFTKNIVQSLTNPPTMQLHFPLYDKLIIYLYLFILMSKIA